MYSMKLLKKTSPSSIPYTYIIPLFVGLSVFAIYKISNLFIQPRSEESVIVSPAEIVSTEVVKTKQPPTSVFIPRINKRLPIQAAIVKDNNWQLFDKSVAWLSTSAVPGQGNVILYAHDWISLWGDLYKVQPGDRVEVDVNGKLFIYEVSESHAVAKNDVESVLSTENRLTMYTCEGSFDQKRRVVYATPL